MSRVSLTIPSHHSHRCDPNDREAIMVELDPETGEVFVPSQGGIRIGVVHKGEYTSSPKAAGHGGRVVRYHSTGDEWRSTPERDLDKPSYQQYGTYRGSIFPSHYRKNTRQAAIAALLTDDHYFTWA